MNTRTVMAPGHKSVKFTWSRSAIPPEDIAWFAESLERQLQSGIEFRDGETIQIGWGLLRIREPTSGTLELDEPDFESIPIKWIPSVDHSLVHLRQQKDVVESIDPSVEPMFPSIRHAASICNHVFDRREIVIERTMPHGSFSGWTIKCADAEHQVGTSDLRLESLFSLAIRLPPIVPFLALPPGFSGMLAPDQIKLSWNGKPINIRKDSILYALGQSRPLRPSS